MRKMISIAYAALACAVLLPTEAAAQQAGGKGGPPGAGAGQTTRDIDRDQIRTPSADRDRDQDRDMDRDQDRLRDPVYLSTRDQLRVHDRDQDGRISKDEFGRWQDDAFTLMDVDNNSGLSFQEFSAARLGPGPMSGSSAKQREQREELVQARKSERFRLMDGDGDGVLTRTEYMKFGELNYLDADTNDDGKLTFKEMQQFHRGM